MARKWITSVSCYEKQVTLEAAIIDAVGGLTMGQNQTCLQWNHHRHLHGLVSTWSACRSLHLNRISPPSIRFT